MLAGQQESAPHAPFTLPLGISADSHVIEPPEAFSRYIAPEFRDHAPRLVHDALKGASYEIDGLPGKISVAQISSCGKRARAGKDAQGNPALFLDEREAPYPEAPFAGGAGNAPPIPLATLRFEDSPPGGWQAAPRLRDQDRDGVMAELLYPTIGMVLCNHPDSAFQSACFRAYNRWLADLVGEAPGRLFGIGQTALRTVHEGVEDFRRIKELGFVGVMLPGAPDIGGAWYESHFDPLWEAAQDLELPVSFHTLASSRNKAAGPALLANNKPKNVNFGMEVMRANQDAITDFVLGGVFERFPDLKLVCVEAGAGWAPDYLYRLGHFYENHRILGKVDTLAKEPTEYFLQNVYLTFQDDPIALSNIAHLNANRLLWANDYPHSDASWPWSRNILSAQMGGLSDAQRQRILCDNVRELYGLNV